MDNTVECVCGCSFVPSPAVCVLGGLMSKQEEVSDGPRIHFWDTTTGELSVSVQHIHTHPETHTQTTIDTSLQQFVFIPIASCMDAQSTAAFFLLSVCQVPVCICWHIYTHIKNHMHTHGSSDNE